MGDGKMFEQFAQQIRLAGAEGAELPEFSLGKEGRYELRYIPFEHVNRAARLVIVGITPGPTQVRLAYGKAQELLQAGLDREAILTEVKKTGSFGGPGMRPNLVRMLQHFRFGELLGIADVTSLWDTNAHLLHSTSVVPYAAFENGKDFKGNFGQVLGSPLLRQCFLDHFVSSLAQMSGDALYVALGECPKAALDWCVSRGHLRQEQVLGAFCHPSTSGGSATKVYLREKSVHELAPGDPVRNRARTLDEDYRRVSKATSSLLGKAPDQRFAPTPSTSTSPLVPVFDTGKHAQTKPAVPRRPKASNEEREEEVRLIIGELVRSGARLVHQTKKVALFETRTGELAYLAREQSRLNEIVLSVHPAHRPEDLARHPGITSAAAGHRFSSNYRRFPTMLNNGQKEEHYGRHVTLGSLDDCKRFLAEF